MKTNAAFGVLVSAAFASLANANVIANQPPVSGGGIARWSQLWQDPGPNGNDLDSDSVCWADFTLAAPTTINHIEWWGIGACELGFRIQFWRQDPNTTAYQPIGVFYYGGDHTVRPEATFDTTAYTTSPGPGGINHYILDLSTPVTLGANDATNPRWFIAIIGLTHQAYYTWDWSQGTGGSNQTFQFIRGSAPQFRRLGEGRAFVLGSPCLTDLNGDNRIDVRDFLAFLSLYAAGETRADFTGDRLVNVGDFLAFLTAYAAGCP
jgi:hypothetical protein